LLPAARHLAESRGLDISNLIGTAKGGRISKGDILQIASKIVSNAVPVVPVVPVALPVIVAPTVPSIITNPANANFTDIPNSNMRKVWLAFDIKGYPRLPLTIAMSQVIAKRLTESKATVPHFYTTTECSLDEVMKLRKSLKKDLDVNVSVNDIVIKVLIYFNNQIMLSSNTGCCTRTQRCSTSKCQME
jgi:pyruvate/2-oxoglutarate dehydrogenase complex dihydrolipoamide acyltransferase (E2) component